MANDDTIPTRRERTIVVADDDLAQVRLLDAMLTQEGYQVVACENGVEVLGYLRENSPTLLVLDVRMPVLDGLDTCSRIKRQPRLKDVPVILLTSYGNEHTRITSHFVGADALLRKPVGRAELVACIDELLASAEDPSADLPTPPELAHALLL